MRWSPGAGGPRSRAVSVLTCSCTTVKRSSRARPSQHAARVGADRRRVGVVHVERHHRRGEGRVGEGAPQLDHVDGARRRARQEVPPLQHAVRRAERAGAHEERAAVRMGVGARERGQAGDGPARHAAVLVPREADAHAEVAARFRAVPSREADDRSAGSPVIGRHALGRRRRARARAAPRSRAWRARCSRGRGGPPATGRASGQRQRAVRPGRIMRCSSACRAVRVR